MPKDRSYHEYRDALAAIGPATPEQIAERLRLPIRQADASLKILRWLGLVDHIDGKYVTIEPEGE